VVYRGANDLRVETVPVPRIGPEEVLVKVAVCGDRPTDIKNQYGTMPPPRLRSPRLETMARVFVHKGERLFACDVMNHDEVSFRLRGQHH
jgi:NADPH:quinone reductase-like Zn-dependent oxidoreductase